ncbi:hypothetical protein GCM10011371_30130 [Novosphingobium marinum]|uniref:DUF885 domain-containing protein n=1 Tax=Novosphingobium marinum TaxID=1514948 RepID=A0A7Z0BWT9_9SPHN|nr:DUF885 domain-containing protein [Novosphingobium marinum]NYH96725.1 hypothetical protein [Novosphingobium marinum]GGC40672.1 hypothetical protein GCM10011371_30130 [Novosphingobium marinum]
MKRFVAAIALATASTFALSPAPLFAQESAAEAPEAPDWVETSNAYTEKVIRMQAEFFPTGASFAGYEEYDGLVDDMSLDRDERYVAAAKSLIEEFRVAREQETNAFVQQDLQILIDSLEMGIAEFELENRLTLEFAQIPQSMFGNIGQLLSDQTAQNRRGKALELLQRYTGTWPDTEPMTELAKARFEASRGEGKIGPYRVEVEESIQKIPTFVSGIRDLFAKYEIEGADNALDAMERQLTDYGKWTRTTVLPLSRDSARLPEELYALNLKRVGIDQDPRQLMREARRGLYELRAQMEALAPQIAEKYGWPETDMASVMLRLKQMTVPDDEIEDFYREVNRKLEAEIRRNDIVSLPDSELQMRVASQAESAAQPAPHMRPPRLIGNTGEQGTFVLTVGNPTAGPEDRYDDFNFPAASWTLSAHEARPGHEMQFAALVEQGVSLARMLYAFNSVNVEGWALYAEAEMLPHEPIEGQFIALQFRLLRAARAFLDPSLNLGMMNRDEAERVLREEALFSPGMTKQELDRYQFRMPGQAGSYYYGYRKLIDLRVETELALGERFDEMAFNDFLLSQGIIPLDLIAKAVREEFIPAQLAR